MTSHSTPQNNSKPSRQEQETASTPFSSQSPSPIGSKNHRVGIVTRFEFLSLWFSKAYRLTTLFFFVVALVTACLPSLKTLLLSGGAPSVKSIVIDNGSAYNLQLEPLQQALPNYRLKLGHVGNQTEAFDQIEKDRLAGVFKIHNREQLEWITARQSSFDFPQEKLAEAVQEQLVLLDLQERGLSSSAAQKLLAKPTVTITDQSALSGKSQSETLWVTYALIFIVYGALMNYGQMTASSVAAEKGSRAMEILITSSDPQSLINGKVFGTGLAGLVQLLISGSGFLVGQLINQAVSGRSALSAAGTALRLPVPVFVMALVTFLLAYLAFAFMLGALGSLVNRLEELNQVIAPAILAVTSTGMLGLFAIFTPEKLWVKIVSFIPFAGVLPSFVRFAMLPFEPIPFAAALFIHTGTVIVASRFASTIYHNGVLRYGQPPRFKEIFQLSKAKGDRP